MDKKQVPSVGRIVHYVMLNGEHRPAIITHVWPSCVNLVVFTDISDYDYLTATLRSSSVMYAEPDSKQTGTWHWPEFVPPVETKSLTEA